MREELAANREGAERASGCFVCQFDTRSCEVPWIEGTLVRAVDRPAKQGGPALRLRLDGDAGGEEGVIALGEHARPAARALVEAGERATGLRIRVYHLRRADGASGAARYRAGLVSPMVVEPDLLLNITDINNAEYCARQYPLRRMIPSPPNMATLKGVITHQAFKEMLKAGAPDVAGPLDQAMGAQAGDIALRQLDPDALRADALPHLDALAQWYGGQRGGLWNTQPDIRAETLLLAPEVGLRGRLDFLASGPGGDALLELKTGQVRAQLPKREHRWQVYGYQTLLAVRQPVSRQRLQAMLLYSGTPGQAESHTIPFTARDLLRVLDLRNQLAIIHATGAVPAPPGAAKCDRCMLRADCQRASGLLGWEAPPDETPAVPVDPADAVWFGRWTELLRLEARAAEDDARTLWRKTPRERREAGMALGGLVQEGGPAPTPSGEWEYTFRCDNTSELREGDSILLSDGDPISGEIVTGAILRLDERGVTVWAPERIHRPALIDRYGSDVTQDRTARNLWRWLDADPRLSALVAGRRAPTFDPAPPLDDPTGALNDEQRMAVARALAARDFLLIQGPPGTGKTAVVAEIVQRAVARGERVLLAAFTNQAVDTVLARTVARGGVAAVRLGHALAVAPALHPWRLAERARAAAEAAGEVSASAGAAPRWLRAALAHAQVVAATTATWSAERYDDAGEALSFDLAIVDEATQLTTPALLGALRLVKRFILVGDERQLPPLVMSAEASQAGLSRPLFTDLLERWGETASVALPRQYRMSPAICDFASQTFYGGALLTDGPARTATLDLRLTPASPLAPVLDPARPLVLLDTPPLPGERGGKVSRAQALAARHLVRELLQGGVAPEQIGVIAPWRAHVAAIRQALQALRAETGGEPVVVDTIDRFQGAERAVILFALGGAPTAAEWAGRGAEFLADPRRLNVALTRAQRKLIVLADVNDLRDNPTLRALRDYCAALYDGRGGVLRYAPRAAL
ncbi:MAG TPA: AAA domain-containing protein [Ktedonobacterales bacterium]